MNKYFDTYHIAEEYYRYLKSKVDDRITIMRRGDKYVVGIDVAYKHDYETNLERKARIRNERIDEILGCQ